MAQQFCLKWNNHMNNMMDVFKSLLSSESMVDVTLACDGLSLKAHKIVLSACSPFFQSLFLENPCKHPIVIMKDMKYPELKAIIEFMYHGEVNVAQDQLSALMKTAETLRVKGLAEMPNEKDSSSKEESSTHRSGSRDGTPPPSKRRRGRVRKRSLSDSNRSDDSQDAKIKPPPSPEIEELSGDMAMDGSSGQFSNLQSQVPMQSLPSHSTNSYQKSSSIPSQDPQIEEPASADESEFGVEPAKLLEQSLTTDDLNARRSSRNTMSSGMELQRRPRSSTADHSSTLVPTSISSDISLGSNQQPESPPDIKPEIIDMEQAMSPVAGPSHSTDNSMMMYMDQSSMSSHPGTSYQDNSALVPQDSQPQGLLNPYVLLKKLNIPDIEKYCGVVKTKQNLSIFESMECSNDVASKINTSKVDHIPLHSSLKLCIKCKVKGEKTLTPWKCKACDQPLCCQRSGERCFDSFHSSLNIPRKHVPSRMLKRGTCRQCKIKGKKNRTYWKCSLCDHPLCCQKNRETCFDQFHAVLSTNPENVSSERISDVRNTSGKDVLNDKNVSIDVSKKNKVESEILEESDDNTDHVPVKLISRKMCLHCKANGKSVRTSWRCRGCCKPLCNQTTGECCFQLFHSSDVEKTENLKLDSEKQQSAEQKNSMHVNSLPTIMSDDHLPLYTMVKRDCVYCKAKGSKALTNWHCNACGKPLCRQRYGNTCFYMYHSPTEGKRPDVKRLLQVFHK